MITQPNIWAELKDLANNDICELVNSTSPIDGVTGAGIAGPSSILHTLDVISEWMNVGTKASPAWLQMSGARGPIHKIGTISTADITGTSAGQLGHSSGVVLVSGRVNTTGYIPDTLFPLALFLTYKRITANFGAGGNISLNWGSGGAAITGIVSAANFAGASMDKMVCLIPLSTAGIPLVKEASLNLVSSVAFTNPGTAAGNIGWHIIYAATFS